MRFQLLGPVVGFSGGRRTELGSPRQRCLLAALLVDVGRVVPIDQLIDRVWGEEPPRTARGTLYSYVTRLRSILGRQERHDECEGRQGGVQVTRHAGGYVLEADPVQIDLHRFRRLVARSRAAPRDEEAGPPLRDALALWQDAALAGLSGAWAEGTRTRLDAERVAALLHFNDIRLRQGACEELLPDLRAQVAVRPLDERLTAQLMTALYRSSCQAEALELYNGLRRRLAGELGVDPDPELQELHRQVLAAAPELRPVRNREIAPPRTVPRQLPLPPAMFVGRRRELAALDGMLAETPGTPGTEGTVRVSAVTGMAGLGKTWLALHWAYRHLARYPDGQIHVDLRGFDPVEAPVAPAAALRRLLDALGAVPAETPADLDSQTALYRSLVAGKRLLIMLDNARDTAQIVPLLPGSPTCTVLVTSRHALAGLYTHQGVRSLALEPLADDEARRLLVGRLGPQRVAAEGRAVSEFLAYSAGLPLALGILATRATSHPDFPLSAIADELHSESTRLDALDTGDLSADLRAVFASSYSALDAKEARLFGLLGLLPVPEISLDAAAALADLPAPGTRVVLNRLVTLHLLQRQSPQRYRMHDLVRLFAAERGHDMRSADAAAPALRRLVAFYVRTALHADRLLSPYRQPIELPPTPGDGSGRTEGGTVPDVTAALSWFDDENGAVAAVQRLAERHGWHEPVWQLAWASETFRFRQGHLQDNLDAWRRAITAAEQLGAIPLSTHTRRYAGRAFALAGEYGEAIEQLSLSLRLIERTGDLSATALTHHALGWVFARQGDYPRALVEARRNLRLIRSDDNPVWTARALNSVGWYLAQSGSYRRARVRCGQALDLFRRHDQHNGVAAALDSLGYISCRTGGYAEAVDRYREARAVYADSGDRYEEANTLTRLGEAYRGLGRRAEAARVWNEALAFYRTQHRSDRVEQILAELKMLQ